MTLIKIVLSDCKTNQRWQSAPKPTLPTPSNSNVIMMNDDDRVGVRGGYTGTRPGKIYIYILCLLTVVKDVDRELYKVAC